MPKRFAARGIAALFLLLAATVPAFNNVASAAPAAPPRDTGGQRFLTLPFNDNRIVVQQGFIYSWGSQHGGIDYVLGGRDTGRWQNFDVVASADGEACGNCTARQGNAVWIKHLINGMIYYTYYGHLASIESFIPIGSQQQTVHVQRGQKIGLSGSTGADSIHLHFQVALATSVPVDPYDLWTTREPYAPGCSACQMGSNMLWTTNPPSFSNGAPPPPPQGTPVPPPPAPPTPTPTPVSNNIVFGKVLQGAITNATPERRYTLRGAAGQWVSIRMFSAEGGSLDTYLKLYSPGGQMLAFDDDGAQVDSNSFMVVRLPAEGTYDLVATRYSGEGAFRLRVDNGSEGSLGDVNYDCVVDKADIAVMMDAVNTGNLAADMNLDGQVDSNDQTIQFYRLGRGCMAFGK